MLLIYCQSDNIHEDKQIFFFIMRPEAKKIEGEKVGQRQRGGKNERDGKRKNRKEKKEIAKDSLEDILTLTKISRKKIILRYREDEQKNEEPKKMKKKK